MLIQSATENAGPLTFNRYRPRSGSALIGCATTAASAARRILYVYSIAKFHPASRRLQNCRLLPKGFATAAKDILRNSNRTCPPGKLLFGSTRGLSADWTITRAQHLKLHPAALALKTPSRVAVAMTGFRKSSMARRQKGLGSAWVLSV